MNPVPAKNLSQNTICHSKLDLESILSPKVVDSSWSLSRTTMRGWNDNHECWNDNHECWNGNLHIFSIEHKFHKNSRPGVAILVVLFVIMMATIISLSFIARSDTELAFGNNMALRMQMDYLAEAGINHAKTMLKNPQDASTGTDGYWEGCSGFSLKDLDFYGLLETGDYYDVDVARDDSDPTDRCSYDVTSRAYRLDGAEKIAQSNLNARLRLDPCIAYWAGAGTTISSQITVNGDVYCSGILTNNGTINGDVFADDFSGVAEGKHYDPCEANVGWPGLMIDDFIPQYYIDTIAYAPQALDANDVLMDVSFVPDSGNPAGVIVCAGNLTLMGNVDINGTLIVNGDLSVQGTNNTITSVKNFPALVVNGRLNVQNGALIINGLAQTNTMSVGAAATGVNISGAVFVRDGGINVEGGCMGNITITAAPMVASLKVSPDAATTVRWTPVGGAFLKWINRE